MELNMTATTVLTIVVFVWLVIGAVTAIVMSRHGYSAYSWAVLGSVLGPLVIPLAWSTLARRRAGGRDTAMRRST
jgi:hypothetical protein